MKIVRLFDIHWDKNSEPPKECSSSQMTIGGRRMLPYCFSKSSNAKRSCVRVKSFSRLQITPTNGVKGKYDHKEFT
jgi:hypothetical protein